MDDMTSVNDGAGIGVEVDRVGRQLAAAFQKTLVQIRKGPYRAQELARELGIKKDLSHRVVRACRSLDPVSVVHLMPGPAPLREFLAAAADQVSPAVLRRAEQAVRAFERLIQECAGDRTSLDAIISQWLPEARQKFEAFNKQAVYRGMAQLKGVSADVSVNTAILNPSGDGSAVDGVWIGGFLGLRRIRPGANVHFSSRRFGIGEEALTLDRQRVEGLHGLLLEQFCTNPLPKLRADQHGRVVNYSLVDHGLGPASAVNLVIAELSPKCMPRYVEGDRRNYGPSAEVSTPSRTLLLDVLVHEEIYPRSDPEVIVIDTAVNGVARLTDPSRKIDRLDLVQEVCPLGDGLPGLPVPEIPEYVKIVRHVMDRAGWPINRFRGYRCNVPYPVYGSQTFMSFVAPDRPNREKIAAP